MKKSNSFMFFLLILLLIPFILSGCLASLKNNPIAIESGHNQVRLSTVSMHGGSDPYASVYQQINEEFMEQYDFIKIYDESQASSTEWKIQISADFAVGNEPDVIQFFTDQNALHVLATDKFVTVEEIRKVYPDYAKDTLPNMLDAAANPDGVIRAVPTVGFWEGLYCNKDLFDKYNLDLPEDPDSFFHAIQVFQANGVIPISLSLNQIPHYWIEFLLLSYSSGDNYPYIPEEASKEWIEGIDVFRTLYEIGAFPNNADFISNDTARKLFTDKKAAMMLEGSWFLSGIPDQDNTVVIPFPLIKETNHPQNTIISGVTTGFYITRKAWDDPIQRDAAVKFVMAHTNKEAVSMYFNGTGPATCDIEFSPDNMTPLALSGQYYYESASKTISPLDSIMKPEAFSVFVSGIADVVLDNMSAQDLIEQVLVVHSKN